MTTDKVNVHVNVICRDGSFVKGYIQTNPGQSIIGFLNTKDEDFIFISDAEFYNIKEIRSFRLLSALCQRGKTMALNKAAVKWIEQV